MIRSAGGKVGMLRLKLLMLIAGKQGPEPRNQHLLHFKEGILSDGIAG